MLKQKQYISESHFFSAPTKASSRTQVIVLKVKKYNSIRKKEKNTFLEFDTKEQVTVQQFYLDQAH